LALLAGHKLLLADDSLTIQKVVELTFSNEGFEVVSVSDGQEAIERIEDVRPDIVLADVFMPGRTGYEVCEYIKQNAKLRHIPVMLLVGSFEPFDEAEARRVGADDILTKPFQSIRRLMDKVGGLVSSKPALPEEPIAKVDEPIADLPKVEEPTTEFLEDKVPTAELPKAEEPVAKRLSTGELEVTTADTRPLSIGESSASYAATPPADLAAARQEGTTATWENRNMESTASESQNDSYRETGDILMDLGDGGPTSVASSEDFVLDIDLDEVFEAPAVASSAFRAPAFAEPQFSQAAVGGWEVQSEEPRIAPAQSISSESAYRNGEFAESSVATPPSPAAVAAPEKREWMHEEAKPAAHVVSDETQSEVVAAQPERVWDEPRETSGTIMPGGQITLDQLSPEVIDAIARRAVAQLSEKVVQEVVWEVVPQLAELLIKRKLEEKESQPN